MNANLWKVMVINQMITSFISFSASSVIAAMIARSRNPRGESPLRVSPYHRIIFGMAISDMLQSFALLTGPFLAPKSSLVPQALLGLGNTATCRFNGFIFIMGSGGTPMYTLCLCLYCFYKIRRKMSDETFSKEIEWKMHFINIFFNVGSCVAALVTKAMNSTVLGNFCAVGANPTGCRLQPDIYGECERQILRAVTILTGINYALMPLLCLLGIVVSMGMVCYYVIKMNNIFRQELKESEVSEVELPQNNDNNWDATGCEMHPPAACATPHHQQQDIQNQRDEPERIHMISVSQCTLEDEESDKIRALDLMMKSCEKDFFLQAILYTSVFFVTFVFVWVSLVALLIFNKEPPTFVFAVMSIIYPLGGAFNILVYTRPKVNSLIRRNVQGEGAHREYSWFKAFWTVVKAGAVVPPAASLRLPRDRAVARIQNRAHPRNSLLRTNAGHETNVAIQSVIGNENFTTVLVRQGEGPNGGLSFSRAVDITTFPVIGTNETL